MATLKGSAAGQAGYKQRSRPTSGETGDRNAASEGNPRGGRVAGGRLGGLIPSTELGAARESGCRAAHAEVSQADAQLVVKALGLGAIVRAAVDLNPVT
jgi:hypothetical protein